MWGQIHQKRVEGIGALESAREAQQEGKGQVWLGVGEMPNCPLCGVGCLYPPRNLTPELMVILVARWPSALLSRWGFSPSVITDVARPHNCVLYFGSGVSRGGWGCRSKPPSLAEHPSHTREGRGDGGRRVGSQGSQK